MYYSDLRVTQRLVVCYFSLLAIINACAIRLCLDFSLKRIVRDCSKLAQAINATIPDERIIEISPSTRQKPPRNVPRRSRQRGGRNPTKQPQQQEIKLSTNALITTSNTADVWTKEVSVLVTVSFYAGYMFTHIPGGRLSERYGAKWILGASIFTAAILTLLTPTIVRCGGPNALMFLRLLIGICEGPTFPAVSALLAQWVPEKERGLLCSCVLSGGEIGVVFIQLVSGFALEDQNWDVAFYIIGSGAMLWFVGFILVCYSCPADSPYIQLGELDYIGSQVSVTPMNQDAFANERVPWTSMLTSAPTWALIASNMQHNWSQQEYAKELERLLDELETKGINMWQELESSLQLMAPHLYNWLSSILYGSLSDYLVERGILNRTQTRRLMSRLVFIGVSMYLVNKREDSARVWSILAFGAFYAGIKLLPLDMSPNYAGTLMGISNGLGSLPGLLMPLLQELESEYKIVGSIRAAMWLIYAGYISGDVQSYNQLPRRS